MAKSKNSSTKSGRNASVISRPLPAPRYYYIPTAKTWTTASGAWDIADGRRFDPTRKVRHPAHYPSKKYPRPSRVVASKKNIFGLNFAQPDRVIKCLKRKIRREVMHASGMAGVRKIMKKKHIRRDFWSRIGC